MLKIPSETAPQLWHCFHRSRTRPTTQYRNGRKLFLKASELDADLVSEEPYFTLEQALNEEWLPDQLE
jgi:hypothetical protein